MVAAVSLPAEVRGKEQRFAAAGVSWKTYVLLRDAIDDAALKMNGSTTYRNAMAERGLEPDECYLLGREAKHGVTPDFAIEVIETKPLVDKLVVYDGLEIPEVWLVESGAIAVHKRKAKGGYARARRSAFLPNLDPKLLERFMSRTDHDAAIHEFADRVKGVGKKKKRR